jgi:DNA-binding MarR family transcriptional regulator
MTQDEAKYKDIILQELLRTKGKGDSVRGIRRKTNLEIYQVKANLEDLIKEGQVNKVKDQFEKLDDGAIIHISSKGENFLTTSSYSSLFKSEQDTENKLISERRANMMFRIISAIAIIYGAFFTFLTFNKNDKIIILEQVDFLKKELKKRALITPKANAAISPSLDKDAVDDGYLDSLVIYIKPQ